jgi:hypothetical protein
MRRGRGAEGEQDTSEGNSAVYFVRGAWLTFSESLTMIAIVNIKSGTQIRNESGYPLHARKSLMRGLALGSGSGAFS